ncbi:hypothetical protein PHMEG_00019968 [Phytophthora megakarya]|uniref:Auto-transporter adhesin head GIN domain-containing protein n=1 Tax=Phytophthora megakarya TaxID=4795 RepID=A0A225VRG8_9STRA|nr:hypothetical protein PHMEG_00019968 [Phytophthora megakarya]
MNVNSCLALLVAAASLTAQASADFKISSSRATKTATAKNAKYVKQWTLKAGAKTNVIDSIDLSLAGNAYVSYMKDLPGDVLGYVNVSGDSREVVDAVTVSKDVSNELTNDLGNMLDIDTNGGELNVVLANRAASGYLLTEIFLGDPETVQELKSQRSAQVVVEEGVLVTDSDRAKVEIDATGSSAVFVSDEDAAVSVKLLSFETTGKGSIEYSVGSIAASKVEMNAEGSSSIAVLSSTVKTTKLDLEVNPESSGEICFSATKVKATTREIEGESSISMPNAVKKHGTTGTEECKASPLPPREAGKVTATAPSLVNTLFDNDDSDLDDDENDLA